MKRHIATLLTLGSTLLFPSSMPAQDVQRTSIQQMKTKRVLLGATLSITVEPDYRPGETGVLVNVFPVAVEWAFSDMVGVRFQSVANLELKSGKFGHVGGGLTMPIYLSDTWYEGWYIGPYAGVTVVSELGGSDVTLAIEGGPRWKIGERFTINLAIQSGVSNLRRSGSTAKWVYHFGVFPSIGYWF